MSTEVVMPQMGESIAEGTITKWLKKVGDRVERDEPLFEISTDKVDAEIPSPAAGVLTEVRFNEGDTVEVNSVVAVLDGEGDQTVSATPAVEEVKPPEPSQPRAEAPSQPPVQVAPPRNIEQPPGPAPAPVATSSSASQPQAAAAAARAQEESVEDLRKTKSSPLVRKIAQEHGVDISKLDGTGLSGRVTKNDILSYIESSGARPGSAPIIEAPLVTPAQPIPDVPAPPPPKPVAGDRVEQMSVMRKKIAEHMVLSRRTSAHVTTVYEIDMTRIAKLRYT